MCEPLTLSVARRSRRLEGSYPHLRGPEGHPRRARVAGTVAGLGRRTRNEPKRLPLERPEPCGPGRQLSRQLFTCAALPHTLSPAGRSPAPSRAGFLPQAIQPFLVSSFLSTQIGRKDAPHQLLQPTRKTSTLWTVRFPSAPADEPCDPSSRANHLRPTASGGSSGGGSLDGDPPALAYQRLPEAGCRAGALMPARARVPRGPGGASIGAPPRGISR